MDQNGTLVLRDKFSSKHIQRLNTELIIVLQEYFYLIITEWMTNFIL